MAINFPKQPEVRLDRSPLSEVICQVKFPPILRIGKEPPTNFQDTIRDRFPGLEIDQGVVQQLGINPAAENPVLGTLPKLYRFKAYDSKSYVGLSYDFFAFSSSNYSHWKDFVNDFSFIEQAVLAEFNPPFVSRIGLRFINRITRKNSGCKTYIELAELLREELTCLIRTDIWKEPIEMISHIVLQDNSAKLILRYGYAKEENEPFFLLDFDYFEDSQLEFKNLSKKIDRYHNKIYQAFRWCLKENSLIHFRPTIGK
jgi:uncharacterized protein (TIGR04255 family)